MQVNNYGYGRNNNFTGYIRLTSPTGYKVVVDPKDIDTLCSHELDALCINKQRFDKDNMAYMQLFRHVLDTTIAIFKPSFRKSCAGVNASVDEVVKAMSLAKKLPDDVIVDVGKPLDYLQEYVFKSFSRYDNFLYHTEEDLKKTYPNTIDVFKTDAYGYKLPRDLKDLRSRSEDILKNFDKELSNF